MTITNGYATLAEYKLIDFPEDVTSTYNDSTIEAWIESASRYIDFKTGRRFYQAAETRYYTAREHEVLHIDDLTSITTLKTDDDGDRTYETTWASTDYDLMPFNAALDNKPYTRIELTPNGTKSFPTVRKGIEIAANFGYSATAPELINHACLQLSSYLMGIKDAPLGFVGPQEFGRIVQNSQAFKQVLLDLRPFIRIRGASI